MKFLFDHDVPDDLMHLLRELGHDVTLLREVLPRTSQDSAVLVYARDKKVVLVTCNRDDFVALTREQAHHGIIVLVRRRTRVAERIAFFRLIERLGESGLVGNINFA